MSDSSSGLPHPALARVAASVSAARLPRLDRRDVEEELSAHFEDGLAEGRSLESLLSDFGDPETAGALLGRSARRRRHARRLPLRAACLFTLAVALAYAGLFARLQLSAPERPVAPLPEARLRFLETWTSAKPGTGPETPEAVRAEFDVLLAAMYGEGDDGRLTSAGLRLYQAWKGKLTPGAWAAFLEPAYFWNAASRGEVRLELDRFLILAADDQSRAFEEELLRWRASSGNALRFAPLEIALPRLEESRRTSR